MDEFAEEQVERHCCDFEPLPALSEDEENVSLADVLSLRDSCLAEQEIWAICLECCQSLKSIAHSAIFQTLCITPDTLAFNTNGNVCFMEQISDDPEGAFLPPEIDVAGNTFEGHIFSLGATLKTVAEYMMEPEIDPELNQDVYTLLEQMQEENPKERPDIETVISLCKEKLNFLSSGDICQCFSTIGRRMLSIESCVSLQDGCSNFWKRKTDVKVSPYEQCIDDDLREKDLKATSGENASDLDPVKETSKGIKRMKISIEDETFCCRDVSGQCTKCKENKSSIKINKPVNLLLDTEPHPSVLETKASPPNCLRKVRTFLDLQPEPVSVPRTFYPFTSHSEPLRIGQYSLQPQSLSLIGNDVPALEGQLDLCDVNKEAEIKASYFQGANSNLLDHYLCPRVTSIYHHSVPTWDDRKTDFLPSRHMDSETSNQNGILDGTNSSGFGYEDQEYFNETSSRSNENCLLHVSRMTAVFTAQNGCSSNVLNPTEQKCSEMTNYHLEDGQCGGGESEVNNNEQCIFLKHLLSQHGKPLKDYELWALCHECLLTMETYTEYPAYLSFDSVMINTDGGVLFVLPKCEGSYDRFYLAPEAAGMDFITEKVCIYCIAAILWRAAKYNFPPNHKVVLPRKLKNFLLDMARRNSEDRPSLADAIKTCDSYLLEQNISSKNILAFLTKSTILNEGNSVDDTLGFLPMSNEARLIAVKGPVPCQTSFHRENVVLPRAFTSSATHFKPIILQQNADVKKVSTESSASQCERTMPREILMKSTNSVFVNAEGQTNEDSHISPVSRTSGVVEHNKQLETSPQSCSTELFLDDSSSSVVTLPLFSETSHCSQDPDPSSSISKCTMSSPMALINNFLLKQDPETRVLTLVPVQIAVSEQVPNKPLRSEMTYSCCPSLHVLLSDSLMTCDASETQENNLLMSRLKRFKPSNVQNECQEMKASINNLSPSTVNKETQTRCSERHLSLCFSKDSSPDAERNVLLSDHTVPVLPDQNSACSLSHETSHQNNDIKGTILEKVVHLIQEAFAFRNYLKNDTDALAIGKYIFSLKDLRYNTFCDAISEKFCDVFWEEKLLANLYEVTNDETILSVSLDEIKCCDETLQIQNDNLLDASEEINVADDPAYDISAKEIRSQNVTVGTETEEECLDAGTRCLGSNLPEETLEQDQSMLNMEENIYSKSFYFSDLAGFCPGWSSAFYGSECFNLEVHNYVRKLGKRSTDRIRAISDKKVELEQLIMIEMKNYRKSVEFYQRLLHKERRTKGGEAKTLLPKLKGQLQEMKSKIQFLELVNKYLQIMCAEKWGIEPRDFLTVVNMGRNETLDITSLDGMLFFYNIYKSQCNENHCQSRNLQAGTPLGLMMYLYSRNAFLDGYVQQFLFTFRYFCSQEEFLQFLLDRIRVTLPNSCLGSCSVHGKIHHRSFTILQAWIKDCYTVDFIINPNFMSTLKEFIISKVAPLSGCGTWFLSLLDNVAGRKESKVDECYRMEGWKGDETNGVQSLRSSCKRTSRGVLCKSFNWRFSKGSEAFVPYRKGIVSGLPKQSKMDGGLCFLTEYTAKHLCCQLTLLEQEIFQKCHPVHFLNSRLLGVKDKSMCLQKLSSSELSAAQVNNLFVENCVHDDFLLQLLKYADNVSTWVAAEIVTSYSSKVQINLLSKFLLVAKCCYEQRNFSTAIQILRGLEHLIVRQLPVWKFLPSKVSEIVEELKAVEVFLKSDCLCLMEGERFKTSPTIPSAHVLTMHIQQLETGGFTMRNGTYKWTKLRNIAKVVSQVHAFQENPYMFPPDHRLQSLLRQRIASFSEADISALAADNCTNFHQMPTEKRSRKIQNTLHKMKSMFQ